MSRTKFNPEMSAFNVEFFKGLGELVEILNPEGHEEYVMFCNEIYSVITKMENQISNYERELNECNTELHAINLKVGKLQKRIEDFNSKM